MADKTQTINANVELVRISPRKLRLVADLVRGKDAEISLDILRFTPKKGALPMFKALRSAIANAQHNNDIHSHDLFVKEVLVNEGPTYKRGRSASKGRVRAILKRTSRITIKLAKKQ